MGAKAATKTKGVTGSAKSDSKRRFRRRNIGGIQHIVLTRDDGDEKVCLAGIANRIAQDHHDNNFASRLGWGEWIGFSGIVEFFSNNPWGTPIGGGSDERVQEESEIRAYMAAHGIEIIDYGSYPPPGDEGAGYTTAFLVSVPDGELDGLIDARREAYEKSWSGSRPRHQPASGSHA